MLSIWVTIFVAVLLVLAFYLGTVYGRKQLIDESKRIWNSEETFCESCNRDSLYFRPNSNRAFCISCETHY